MQKSLSHKWKSFFRVLKSLDVKSSSHPHILQLEVVNFKWPAIKLSNDMSRPLTLLFPCTVRVLNFSPFPFSKPRRVM